MLLTCPTCCEEFPDLDHNCIIKNLPNHSSKVIRDGKVAVIYSWLRGKWSTSINNTDCLFCPEIVDAILNHKNLYCPRVDPEEYDEIEKDLKNKVCKIASEKGWITNNLNVFNEQHLGMHLAIEWVPLGDEFWIDWYNGHEAVHYISKARQQSFVVCKA